MEHKKTAIPDCEVITEDRRGLKQIDGLLDRLASAPASTDKLDDGGSLRGSVSDGQVLADGSATLTYDAGQVAWMLEAGDAPIDKVVSLLRVLADRLHSLDEAGTLPTKVSPAPESADVSVVPNEFG